MLFSRSAKSKKQKMSTNSESESNYSESDSDTENSDEYFIKFESTTNYEHVDYVMIGSSCYNVFDENNSSNQDSDDSKEDECTECIHDVLIYYINGYIDQQMISKNEINDICRLQGITLSSHDIFNHLLD
jgi:hypothetical protein